MEMSLRQLCPSPPDSLADFVKLQVSQAFVPELTSESAE